MGLDSTIIVKPSPMKMFLELEEHLDFLELNPHKKVPEDMQYCLDNIFTAKLNSEQFRVISNSWQSRLSSANMNLSKIILDMIVAILPTRKLSLTLPLLEKLFHFISLNDALLVFTAMQLVEYILTSLNKEDLNIYLPSMIIPAQHWIPVLRTKLEQVSNLTVPLNYATMLLKPDDLLKTQRLITSPLEVHTMASNLINKLDCMQ